MAYKHLITLLGKIDYYSSGIAFVIVVNSCFLFKKFKEMEKSVAGSTQSRL